LFEMKIFRLAAAVLVPPILAGCAARPALIRKPFVPPAIVAVLPFANDSNNMEAPELMQKLAWLGLERGGYRMVPLQESVERLRKAGITVGGQLGSKTAPELASLLGADAVLYGTVTKFSYVTLGVYLKRQVAVDASLVSSDGSVIWRDSASATRTLIELDTRRAARELAIQLAVKWVEKIVSHPLYPEMQRSLYELFSTLPAANGGANVGKRMDRGFDRWWDSWVPFLGRLFDFAARKH